jgi:hypothetical protein
MMHVERACTALFPLRLTATIAPSATCNVGCKHAAELLGTPSSIAVEMRTIIETYFH